MRELETIQSTFLAHLLGQRVSVSHAALRKETGVQPIAQIVSKMKLNYWNHLTKAPKNTWLEAAYRECFPLKDQPVNQATVNQTNPSQTVKPSWKSSYAKEINEIMTNIDFDENKTSPGKQKFKTRVSRLAKKHFISLDNKTIAEQRAHSLRAYPVFTTSGNPLSYLSNIKGRKILTKFRLGDAGLGNRTSFPVKTCPICGTQNNTESHLVFECQGVQLIRNEMGPFPDKIQQCANIDLKLQHFLNSTGINPEELQKRAEFLQELLIYHANELDKFNVNPVPNQHNSSLAEKCPFCEFTSNTVLGIKIHKGKMHKNQN